MKLTILVGLFYLISATYAGQNEEIRLAAQDPIAMLKLFNNFQSANDKHYSRLETRQRLKNFNKFVKFAAELNERDEDVQYGITLFADYTPEEANRMLGINQTALEESLKKYQSEEHEAPAPAQQAVGNANNVRYGPAKNQNPCGSCWAFAASALLEGHAYLVSNRYVAFSEQEVIDCTHGSGTNGGIIHNGLTTIKKQNHLTTEASYPYERRDGQCRARQHANALPYRITNVRIVSGDGTMLRELQTAPVAVSMAFPRALQAFRGGLYSGGDCPGVNINHGVTVVGYTNSYWKVRNSWGTNWGESGYIRFSRAVNNICKISSSISAISVQRTQVEELEE